MLQKITCFEQVKDLSQIILCNCGESGETYEVLSVDHSIIKMIRRGEYSRIRVLPFENIIMEEWYFDNGIPDNLKSNADSQLLKSKS